MTGSSGDFSAELVPGCAWTIAAILSRTALPKGAFNLVMGAGATVGAALVDSPHVDAVSFTGSVATGGRIVATYAARGGKVQCEMGGNSYQRPALITETTGSMTINRGEVFGPVASVIRASGYDEALALANDTEFGLSAGICTTSLKHATHFKRHAQAGMVMVNLPTAGVDYHGPFGGRKGSSYGSRKHGGYAAEFDTAVKTAYTAA